MGQEVDVDERACEARGLANLFGACARAFLGEPTRETVGDVRACRAALGLQAQAEDDEDLAALGVRFGERMFVAVSPYYVPLQESCVFGSTVADGGRVRYGSVQSSRSDHVLRCYKAVGFDPGALDASELVRGTMHADSLGCELAFLSYLSSGEAAAWQGGDEATAGHWHGLLRQFAREHASAWFGTAAERLAATDEDFYARTCALAAAAVEGLLEE